MRHPMIDDCRRHRELFQRLLQDSQPATELTPHDGVLAMSFMDGSTRVLDVRAEMLGGEFVFEALEPITIHFCEEESNHGVAHDPVDETIDDLPENGLSAQLFEQAGCHDSYLHALRQLGRFLNRIYSVVAAQAFARIFVGRIEQLRLFPLDLRAARVPHFGKSVTERDTGRG